MKRNAVLAAGLAAGFLFAAPVAAFATEKPAPESHYAAIGVIDKSIYPGQEVVVMASCWVQDMPDTAYTSSLLGGGKLEVLGRDETTNLSAKAVVPKTAKLGTYTVSFVCGGKKVSGKFEVERDPKAPVTTKPTQPVKPAAPAKQVAKVPTGAPQTGGTDGPRDDSSAVAIAAAGLGVVALGGAGIALGRRRRTIQN